MKTQQRRPLGVMGGVMALTLLCGCEKPTEFVPPPPPEVTVQQSQTRQIVDHVNFTGNTRAMATVELRARVSGYLQRIVFEDGALVQQGDLLFVIEPAPFQAILESRLADLERARAALQLAQVEFRRNQRLQQKTIVSQQDLDQRRADLATAKADVAVAQAAVTNAQLDLDYTEIRAPISGRIGRHLVDVGNLIQSEQTLLATIESMDPIYAHFYVSESDLLRFRQMIRDHELPDPQQQPPSCDSDCPTKRGIRMKAASTFATLASTPIPVPFSCGRAFPIPPRCCCPDSLSACKHPLAPPSHAL
jgi:RND family efflux transporter MFP subunit